MGITVVDTTVSSGNWNKQKPDGYDSKDLDKALKAYEGLTGKAPSMPASFPAVPNQSVKEFEACIKTLDAAITDMKKAVTYMKQVSDAAKSVAGAAGKTAGDLQKQAKDKEGKEKEKYLSAASAASGIGSQAAAIQKKLE